MLTKETNPNPMNKTFLIIVLKLTLLVSFFTFFSIGAFLLLPWEFATILIILFIFSISLLTKI